VERIEKVKKYYKITAKNGNNETRTYETKSIIIATGIHPRHLEIPGEKEFYQKGVTYCTVCDGPLFKNKTTVTIGSGNAALESVLMMSGIAKKIYLLSKFPNTSEQKGGFPKGEEILIDKVKGLPNIEIIYSANTTEIVGADRVTRLKYKNRTTIKAKNICNNSKYLPLIPAYFPLKDTKIFFKSSNSPINPKANKVKIKINVSLLGGK